MLKIGQRVSINPKAISHLYDDAFLEDLYRYPNGLLSEDYKTAKLAAETINPKRPIGIVLSEVNMLGNIHIKLVSRLGEYSCYMEIEDVKSIPKNMPEV